MIKSAKAFTLTELVLVIAMMSILAIGMGPPLIRAVQQYDIVWSRREALAQARAAMDRMVKEIRLIESSADVVTVSASDSFQFEYPNGTAITFDKNGTDLRRDSDVLAENVSALEFKYYDSSGSETSTAANVRRIQITLTLDAQHNHGSLTLRTNVFLRNTGNNYDDFSIQ